LPGERLAHLRAFAAVTIFGGLRRLGFEPGLDLAFPRLVAACQCALLAWLHPSGSLRAWAGDRRRSRRLIISRRALQARYGRRGTADGAVPDAVDRTLRRAS